MVHSIIPLKEKRMQKEAAFLFKVGLMVVVGLLTLATLIFVAGDFHLKKEGWGLVIVFDDVAGLEDDAPVRLGGMEVGKVRSLRMKDGRIYVETWLIEEAKIHDDAMVTVESKGLIGEKYISITRGSTNRPFLRDGAKIHGEDPITFREVLGRGEGIATKIEYVTKKLEEGAMILDRGIRESEIPRRMDGIIKNVESITSNLDTLISSISMEGVASSLSSLEESSKELRKVTKEIHSATIKITSILDEFEKGFRGKGDEIGKLIENLEDATCNLNSTLDSIEDITKHIKEGKGLVGKIIFDEKIAKDLEGAIFDLRKLTKDLRAHPWKLLRER